MGAPNGNKNALGCENSGRPKKFDNPEQLWNLFIEYKEHIKQTPIQKKEFVVSKYKNEVKTIELERPLTWEGFELYIDVYSLRDYKNKYVEFSQVITRIEKTIYKDKFEGASAGVFNANIIARDLGLKDQTENKNTHEMSEDTIKLLNNLNDKLK